MCANNEYIHNKIMLKYSFGGAMSIFDFFHKDNVSCLLDSIHPDIKGLIWVKNGKHKNYDDENNESFKTRRLKASGFHYNVSLESGIYREMIGYNADGSQNKVIEDMSEEPSLIDVFLPFSKPKDNVAPLFYSPSYKILTPEQRWTYLEFLKNPYDNIVDIGYVFLLYYGLERHLLLGEKEHAQKVILKLRDVHEDKVFQQYSAKAIILSNMQDENVENIKKFLISLDKEHEFLFSNNLYLFCAYLFDIPLSSKDIIRMSKTFGFTNQNYIKKPLKFFISI